MGVLLRVAVVGTPVPYTVQLVATLQREVAAVGILGFEIVLASDLLHALTQDLLLGDCSHYSAAFEVHQVFELTLLCALNSGCACTESHFADPALCSQFDAKLRQVLDRQGLTYTVLAGSLRQCCDTALQALEHLSSRSERVTNRAKGTPWHWNCECCSDADGEQKLFARLLKNTHSVRP